MKIGTKRIEEIREKKIRKTMKKKGLFNPKDTIIEPSSNKEKLEYLNLRKLKPLAIDLYNGTKGLIDHVQTFLSHIH